MSSPRNRQFLTLVLIVGAMAFGMVLAGGLDMTPTAVSSDARPAATAAGHAAVVPASSAGVPSFADLAEAVEPAVVTIQATTIERGAQRRDRGGNQDPFEFFFGPRRGPRQPEDFRSDSGGSGFIISSDGLVVTNNHVVDGAESLKVLLNGREYEAEVRGTDPATDIALLKIDVGHELTYLRLGDSEALRVGDWVMAIGSPLQLYQSVTVGVVSAKGRTLGINELSFENFIQTDAAINFGNSGGPLVNLKGEVIGINTAINFGAENIGFAVPVSTLRQILPQLRDSGRVSRGYLGIEITNLDFRAAEAFGMESTDGALVARVVDGQPGDKAGLRNGDIIVKVDDRPVEDTRDLIDYVSAKGPDSTVSLDVLRNGERIEKKVTLAERPTAAETAAAPQLEEESTIDWLGLRYQDLTPGARSTHGIPEDVDGVWITQVAPDSPLWDEGVRANNAIHIITEVNGESVANVAEFERLVADAQSGSRLRVYIRRFAQGQEAGPLFVFPAVP